MPSTVESDRHDRALDLLLLLAIGSDELLILEKLAAGLTEHEIAEAFGISCESIRYDLRRICRVLGARNPSHCVAIALRRGLIA